MSTTASVPRQGATEVELQAFSHPDSAFDSDARTGPLQRRLTIAREASIVFTGPRSNGKSSLAVMAGLLLGRRVLDADNHEMVFNESTQMPNTALKRQRDMEPSQDGRPEWTKAILTRYERGCVIACGPILATKACREFTQKYGQTHPIIYVHNGKINMRCTEKPWIKELLYMCQRLSNQEFFNLPERWKDEGGQQSSGEKELATVLPHRQLNKRRVQALQKTQASLARFLASALGYDASSLSHTIFPTLYPRLPQDRAFSTLARINLMHEDQDVLELPSGVDAVEIVNETDSSFAQNESYAERATRLISELRRFLDVPIIYHIEAEEPIRDQVDWDKYMTMLYQGLRLAPEYMTITLSATDSKIRELCQNRGYTTIVGHHEQEKYTKSFWASEEAQRCYQRAVDLGCGVVRMLKKGGPVADNYECLAFSAKIGSMPNATPIIAYNTGDTGYLSRVCSPILAPIEGRADGTFSHNPTVEARYLHLFSSRILDPLRFYVFGSSVRHSMSPAMHNVAFRDLGMSHTYHVKETTMLEDLPSVWDDHSFGGASISLPFKKDILRYARHRSPSVKIIGAANTILPIRTHIDGREPTFIDYRSKEFRHKAGPVQGLYADNTDWMGICACLSRSISPANTINSETVGVVIGAGGMARAAVYGLLYLGVRNICIYNRTNARAYSMATHFRQIFDDFASSKKPNDLSKATPAENDSTRGLRIIVIESVETSWPANWKAPTIIIGAIKVQSQQSTTSPPFTIPRSWMHSPTGGVVVELAFHSPETHIMKQFREEGPKGWTLVDPIEVFYTQACTQFELFTGCRAPAKKMREACLQDYAEKMMMGVWNS